MRFGIDKDGKLVTVADLEAAGVMVNRDVKSLTDVVAEIYNGLIKQ